MNGTLVIGFKRHLQVTTVPGEAVYLSSPRGTVAVSGRRFQTLAPLLDGSRSLAEVQEKVAPEWSAGQLGDVLGRLAAANLVGYRRRSLSRTFAPADAYWDLAGARPDWDGTPGTSVRVVCLEGIDAGPVVEGCRAAGLATTDEDTATVSLVLCHDYLDPALQEINARRLADGLPWLLAKPVGADLWIGPMFRPREGPCWACLAIRLRQQRTGEACVNQAIGAAEYPEASLAATRSIGLQLAILQMAKWLAGISDGGHDLIWTLDTVTLEAGRHRVTRRPQCAECADLGATAQRVMRPIAITSRRKTQSGGNGHRAISLEQVWERYGHLVDPLTGIMGEIRRDPRSPGFAHSYLSGPNRALGADCLSAVRAGLRQQSGGKGRTELEARTGALCEAVERYSASRHGDEPVVRDSFRGLGAQAIHPDSCQLFHPRQFRDRERWNANNALFQRVPEPFDEDEPIDWTPVWSLITGDRRLLPTDMLYYRARLRDGAASVRADSNGNAAGGSLEDAILQGFLELVERDAVALWWYNRTRHAVVNLTSSGDPWISEQHERYSQLRREVWVLDITSDLGIPAMAAISRRVDKPAEDIVFGFGAHFDPEVALRRALTELAQVLPAVVNIGRDGTGYPRVDSQLQWWWSEAMVSNQPYLLPVPEQESLILNEYPYKARDDLGKDIEYVCALARRNELDILVLDQTRPDIGMPVVKVVVPGLRHFWARFAPGRLYDVPVKLERIERATKYEDLNPIPLFM